LATIITFIIPPCRRAGGSACDVARLEQTHDTVPAPPTCSAGLFFGERGQRGDS